MTTASEDLFKKNLNRISEILRGIDAKDPLSAILANEPVQRILGCCDSLPEKESQELIQGLGDLARRLERHFLVETALVIALSDRTLVPTNVLLAILKHPKVAGCPSAVYEELFASIPEHLRPS